jgi:hypothetical protein
LGGHFYLNSAIYLYPRYGLECWLKEAKKRAALLFERDKR